jgi:prefoldin subunit 5
VEKAANAALEELQAKFDALLKSTNDLSAKLAMTYKLMDAANAKLKKICAAKPKPKGC